MIGWLLLGGAALYQGLWLWNEFTERDAAYGFAVGEARRRGKPLLVVGGPLGTNLGRRLLGLAAHGPGDT